MVDLVHACAAVGNENPFCKTLSKTLPKNSQLLA
jgi:hypothetical protein